MIEPFVSSWVSWSGRDGAVAAQRIYDSSIPLGRSVAGLLRARFGAALANHDDSRRVRRSLTRWGTLVVIAVVVVIGVLGSIARKQERSLAAVEKLLSAGDVAAATRELAVHQREYPDDGRAFALRARILLKVNRPREAAQLFEQHGAASAADLHAWAQSYLMQSQWSLAAPILTRFLQLQPEDPNGLHELMVCNIRMGRLKEALDLASQMARLPKQEILGHLSLGTVYNDLKNKEQAVVEFRKVLQLDPGLTGLSVPPEDFLSEYGGTLVSLGRSEEAVSILKRSLATRATADAAESLGQAVLQLGETRQAVANWELAMKLDPQSHRAREGLADVALREGRGQDALELLKPLEESPKLEPATAFLLQQIYQRLGDSETATTWQKRTAQLRRKREVETSIDQLHVEAPQSYWAQVTRAYRFAEAGNWSEADFLMQQIRDSDSPDEFVRQFRQAVKTHGTLPSLETIPIRLF